MFENNPFIKTLKVIWEKPRYVFVDEKKIKLFAKVLAADDLVAPSWQIPNVVPERSDETFIEYLGWVNSVNFCFTNFLPPHYKYTIEFPARTIWSGALALGAAFMRAFEDTDFRIAGYMKNLSSKQAQKFFEGIYPIPLFDLRVAILREVGQILSEKFDGRWINLFEESNWRVFNNGKGIVELLMNNFPSFRDESQHLESGTTLKFYKRAQLIPLMYQGRAINSINKLPLLKDADDIGPIADYSVPKVLYSLEVLRYSPELEKEIKERMIIPKDSLKEQEIRAQMSYVMIKLVEEINKYRKSKDQINMTNLDYKIWSLRGKYKKLPHHLTPTTNY